ncbi:MAG: hypothetical protein C3F06_00090 [Candidatus Methanoperedenaceae archaeon]|nr:MAG: hypothetical protein C3F06_00090 [Candidatus Methanoperedenaceae archaeon]
MKIKKIVKRSKVLYFLLVMTILTAVTSIVTASSAIEHQSNVNYRIDEHLREIVNNQTSNEIISVIIILKEQPAHDISLKVKNEYKKQFEDITEPAKPIYGRIKPIIKSKKGKNISELVGLEQSLLTEKEKAVLGRVGMDIESRTRQMRREILNQTIPAVEGIQAPLIAEIKAKGGNIKYSSKILNAIAADIPISYISELSQDQGVYKIYHDYLLNASLDTSSPAMGANTWWSNGYNGSVMDAAVVDTGIDASHPALGVDYAGVFHINALKYYRSIYADNSTDPDDFMGHGTHVAGIVASNDSRYRGPAYGIDKLINAKAGWKGTDGGGYMLWSDAMQAFDWSIFGNPDDADVISLSFGGGTTSGNSGFEHFLDAIVYDLDIQVVVANGNSGPGSSTVGEPAGAFNILAVGNVDDRKTVSRGDDMIVYSSSRGPTLDGRTKPDISAPGTSIMSANNNWETGPDFISLSGTSMATPQITGSVLLILDYKNFRWQPEAIKALLLNTAEDKGTAGPDNDYGFGYVNLSNTYIHRDDLSTGSIGDLPNGSRFYKGIANNGDRATLVWNRHVTYNGPNYPVSYPGISDLDLLMYNEANGAIVSASTSRLNNVEQVKSNANYGSAILKIDPYGTFPSGITYEEYALAADEQFTNVTPPALGLNVSNQQNITSGGNFILNVTINNSGEINAQDVNASLNLPSGFLIVSGANPQSIGIINPGGYRNASWVIRAPNVVPATLYTLNAYANSNSYGELYSGGGNNTILVLADITPPASVTSLMNISYSRNHINWTWTDPQDTDFAKVEIYINDVYQHDVLKGIKSFNATDLESWTSYTISTRTVDSSGNINTTFISNTASTELPLVRYINGTLFDSISNTGISGGVVSTNTNLSTITNATGFYSFNVTEGNYELTAGLNPTYYTNSSIIVSTIGSFEVMQDIKLEKKPTGIISGTIMNA